MATNDHSDRQHIIIIGCGRLGVELALSLAHKKHSVCVVDSNQRAFDRLGPDFVGRTVQGEAVDQDVLLRAGIEETHAFAAVTSSDSVNIVTSRVARDIYKVHHVIARIYNPSKAVIYEKLGLQTVATTSWGAQRFEQLILHTGFRSLGSIGNGEVQLYEFTVPAITQGKKLSDLPPNDQVVVVAITRGGKTILPHGDLTLQEHDIVQVSATSAGASMLRQRLSVAEGKAA